jgi:hypothetical protein
MGKLKPQEGNDSPRVTKRVYTEPDCLWSVAPQKQTVLEDDLLKLTQRDHQPQWVSPQWTQAPELAGNLVCFAWTIQERDSGNSCRAVKGPWAWSQEACVQMWPWAHGDPRLVPHLPQSRLALSSVNRVITPHSPDHSRPHKEDIEQSKQQKVLDNFLPAWSETTDVQPNLFTHKLGIPSCHQAHTFSDTGAVHWHPNLVPPSSQVSSNSGKVKMGLYFLQRWEPQTENNIYLKNNNLPSGHGYIVYWIGCGVITRPRERTTSCRKSVGSHCQRKEICLLSTSNVW